MKIGLIPANVGQESVEQMVGMRRFEESLKFESLWTFEHAMAPADYPTSETSLTGCTTASVVQPPGDTCQAHLRKQINHSL